MSGAKDAVWTRVCLVADLEADRPLGARVSDTGQDRDRVCVIAHANRHVAMLDRCPHRDIALSEGIVHGGELVCPGHFWRFDLATGMRVDDAAATLTTYPTRIIDGWVEALIPPAAPRRSMRDWLLTEAGLNNADSASP